MNADSTKGLSSIERFRRRMHRWLRLHHVHRHRAVAHTAGSLLILAGATCLVVGAALSFFHWTGAPAGETSTTTGVFVKNGPWPGCEDTAAFKVDGARYAIQVRSFTANGGYAPRGSYCANHRIGSQISIAYSPTNPAHASVQFNRPLLVCIAFLLLGVLFVFLGWLFIPPTTDGDAEAPPHAGSQTTDALA